MKKILGILILCLVCCGFTVNSDEDKKNACEFKSNAFQSCSLNEDDECVCFEITKSCVKDGQNKRG